jgi:Domain of unknown function (DUF4787)
MRKRRSEKHPKQRFDPTLTSKITTPFATCQPPSEANMVTPKFDSRSTAKTPIPSPSFISSYYILILVKLLLVLIIIFSLPKLVAGRPSQHRRQEKRWQLQLRSRRRDCQNTGLCPLRYPVPEESLNCVNQCISRPCFQEIYNATEAGPLEDGEVDIPRAKAFEKCVLAELRPQRRHQAMNGRAATGIV